MRLTCSSCGAHGSIEQFTADADARNAIAMVLKLPSGVGGVALRYIGLFRPKKRGLTWDRVCKLFAEIAAMLEAGHVERRGIRYPASPTLFQHAMQQMLDQRDRLELPLTSHGYLVAIIAGDSPREAAKLESQTEAEKRAASLKRSGPVETDAERMERMRRQQEEAEQRFNPRQLVQAALKRGHA